MDEMMKKIEALEAKLQMSEIARRDENAKAEQKLNRLGKELSSYYSDCMEAKNVPMTAELGEVLLDQITDVFKILAQYGIKMN